MAVTIGVLALQGGFQEHISLLVKAAAHLRASKSWSRWQQKNHELDFIEVRNADDLSRCEALVIPGGESTTIVLSAARSGLLEPLRKFVKIDRKPVWGTCAGLIVLAEQANATKKGGQELIGGLDVRVQRNHFGRQIESFVADMDLPFLAELDGGGGDGNTPPAPYPGVFIRAPIVEELLACDGAGQPVGEEEQGREQAKSRVDVLAVLPGRTVRAKGGEVEAESSGHVTDIVAVRQGNVFGTSFHPELTDDVRVHAWWLSQVLDQLESK